MAAGQRTDHGTPSGVCAADERSGRQKLPRSTLLASVAWLLVVLAVGGCAPSEPVVVEDAPRPEATSEATTSVTPLEDLEITLEPFAEGFDQPLYVTGTGTDDGTLVVLEKTGRAWLLEEGERVDVPFLDLSDIVSTSSEQGLLGMAFPSDFSDHGRFYVDYTDPDGSTVVSRFEVGDSGLGDPASEEVLLEFSQPYANHNGGMIAFGPDELLYIATGDGGSGGDPQGNGQDLGTYLGKLLRIDVEFDEDMHGGDPDRIAYVTPTDNPFNDQAGARPEIWAYGLRNPWRISFDRDTGDLWMGDVGQNAWEEIDFQPAESTGGENYGWAVLEGTHPHPSGSDPGDTSGYTMPVIEYDRAAGKSVTGGYVYRGSDHPDLEGVYIYGDFVSGRIWGLRRSGDDVENVLLAETGRAIASFGEDDRGELYVVDFGGEILRLVAAER
jgi:glucose/arabinose dehydrogenase